MSIDHSDTTSSDDKESLENVNNVVLTGDIGDEEDAFLVLLDGDSSSANIEDEDNSTVIDDSGGEETSGQLTLLQLALELSTVLEVDSSQESSEGIDDDTSTLDSSSSEENIELDSSSWEIVELLSDDGTLASDITHEWEFLEDVEVDDDDLSSLDISLESTEVETVSDGSTLASEITLDLESLDNVEDILEGFNVENE